MEPLTNSETPSSPDPQQPGPTTVPPPVASPPAPQTTPPPASASSATAAKSLPGWVGILIVAIICGVFIAIGRWIFVPIIIIVIVGYIYAIKRQSNAVKAFAKQHNLQFQTMMVLDDVDGVIFRNSGVIQSTGLSKGIMASWLVSGSSNNTTFRLYEHRLSLGRNDSTNFAVMDIAMRGNGLRFLLVSKTHKSTINDVGTGLQTYHLEGNFDSFFTLYGPAGSEVEILQIFTPDIMASLIDHYQAYDIELTPQHLFLYRQDPNVLKTVSSLEQMMQDATGLSSKFFAVVNKVAT